MINVFNIVLFSTYTVSLLILLYLIIKLSAQKKLILAKFIQSEMDNYLIRQQFEQLVEENSIRELSESDGFVKFISQSRDWAFQYIEEVQAALKEFDYEVAADFQWAKTYGMVLGETTHTTVLKRISEAYDKLKSVLPENTETPNN
jgi:hypothetical protein